MDTQKVSIIIPNYNGADLLRKNLPKVIESAKHYSVNTEIIVVDDKSTDDSIELLSKLFPKIVLLRKEMNQGFSSTCNLGVKKAHGDIVVLLNSDVYPDKDFLFPLIKHFSDETVFAVGCLDKSRENGREVNRGRGIGQFVKGFLHHRRGEVDKTNTLWVSGGSSAFDKKKWEELGGFDQIYNPFYWEDIDLSYRAHKKGWRVIFEPKSVAYHYHEEGVIHKSYSLLKIKTIAYRNQIIFVWKNITDTDLILQNLLFMSLHLIKSAIRGDFAFLAGFLLATIKLPKILYYRVKAIGSSVSDKKILSQFGDEP